MIFRKKDANANTNKFIIVKQGIWFGCYEQTETVVGDDLASVVTSFIVFVIRYRTVVYGKMQKLEKKISATALLSELTKLKSQQKYLEATQMILKPVSQTATEAAELDTLDCMKIESELNVAAFTEKLKYDAVHIRNLIANFRDEMLNKDSLCKFNTKQYRERIEDIDQRLRGLEMKNQQQLKQLKLEYCHVECEILPLINGLDLLQRSPMNITIGRKMNSAMNMRRAVSAPIDKTDSEDIRRFDRFVKEHNGHTGGWIDEEHALYVKMKNKYKNNVAQISDAFRVFFVGK